MDPSYPLTHFQRDIWVACEFRQDDTSYNIPIGVWLDGALEHARLEAALDWVIQQHDVLRASFHLEGERPVQRIRTQARVTWTYREFQPEEPQDEFHSWTQSFVTRRFRLSEDLPVRAALVSIETTRHALLIVVHHIVFDAWSGALLLRDLLAAYAALRHGKPPTMPPLRLQYVEYARDQARELRSLRPQGRTAAHIARLSSTEDVLLPADFRRTDVVTYPCDSVPVVLSGDTLTQLNALNRQMRTTSFMVLLAVFNLLMYSRSRRNGLRIACPVSCRERAEHMALIGCMVNTLLYAVPIDEEQEVEAYLNCTREAVLDGLSGRQVSPGALFGLIGKNGMRQIQTPYRVMFSFEEHSSRQTVAAATDELSVSQFVLHNKTAKCDLTLLLGSRQQEIFGALEYRTDLFRRETAQSFVDDFVRLLRSALAEPNARVKDLLERVDFPSTPAARAHIARNPHPTAMRPTDLAHERIASMARRFPHRIAVQTDDGSLTFGQLDRLSNRIARALLARKVGLDDRIGVVFTASAETVLCLVGVWKAGAAYVPLTADMPVERLAHQITDSRLRVLIVPETFSGSVPPQVPLWRFDPHQLSLYSEEPLPISVPPQCLAYVIYTSGSTGRPKGVMITHEGLSNYLAWCVDAYDMHAGASLMHTSALSDLMVTPLWGSLAAGQSLHLAPPAPGIEGLRQSLARTAYQLVKMTPSHLRILAQTREPEEARPWCGVCVLGGEALSEQDVDRWRGSGCRLINEYGPTETVVGSIAYEVGAWTFGLSVPIGTPISNTRVTLVGPDENALPAGAIGEIRIGGAGVARGYQNQPALTAQCFVPDVSRDEDAFGMRLYRSRDLGVLAADGNLEYLGRRDDQVKIRGHRVELGEIEANLLRHPDVRQAAVLLEAQETGAQQLTAYVCTQTLSSASAPPLRDFLRRSLPAHMIPALFVFLEAMPLLENGKVDRQALARPAGAQRVSRQRPPAAGPLEEQIQRIWREVLGHENFSRDDNFFDVGGDSLLLYSVHVRLKSLLQTEMPPTALFEFPTVRGLAAHLSSPDVQLRGRVGLPPSVAQEQRARIARTANLLRRE